MEDGVGIFEKMVIWFLSNFHHCEIKLADLKTNYNNIFAKGQHTKTIWINVHSVQCAKIEILKSNTSEFPKASTRSSTPKRLHGYKKKMQS